MWPQNTPKSLKILCTLRKTWSGVLIRFRELGTL